MKETTPWKEETCFVECPYCGEVETLGEGVFHDKDEIWQCPDCKKEYVAKANLD